MKEEKLLPRKRFKGYTNVWEVRKLESIYQKIRNAFVGIATPYYVKHGNFYLQSNNVKDGQINRITEVFINDEFYKKQKDKLLHTGDVVMVQSGHVGHTAVITDEFDGLAAHALIMFQGVHEKANSQFINFQFQTKNVKGKLNNITTGNTIKHILASEMANFELKITGIDEQNQISSFFCNIDNLISLQQRKLEKTKALKSAYFAEMFPAEGERVPKRRFAGFTEEWEEWKVSDIGNNYYGGGTPKTKVEDYWDGEIPWLQSSDLKEDLLFLNTIKNKITNAGLENSATKLIPANSIAIVTRVGVGKLSLVPHSYTTSQDFFSISNLNVDPIFGVYVLYKLLQKEKEIVQGTSIKGITKEDLLTKNILISNSLEEQIKIGELFKRLDDTIANLERKLKKLKAMKQAYLQEMFV